MVPQERICNAQWRRLQLYTVAFLLDDRDEPILEWFYVAVGVESEDLPLSVSRETLLQILVLFPWEEVPRYDCRHYETFDDYTGHGFYEQVGKYTFLVVAARRQDAGGSVFAGMFGFAGGATEDTMPLSHSMASLVPVLVSWPGLWS